MTPTTSPDTNVVLSGGLDSTVALARAISPGRKVRALFFEYGQRHGGEREAAEAVARHYAVPLVKLNLAGMLHSRSLLESSVEEVPQGAYQRENVASTEVQGRNLLFASIAIAQARKGDSVVMGVHGGDHDLYPDCRPEFWQGVKTLAQSYEVKIETPFLKLTKSQIVEMGAQLRAPLGRTWSCYEGGDRHCGKCATCEERREAFSQAGVPDPTVYVIGGTDAS